MLAKLASEEQKKLAVLVTWEQDSVVVVEVNGHSHSAEEDEDLEHHHFAVADVVFVNDCLAVHLVG